MKTLNATANVIALWFVAEVAGIVLVLMYVGGII